MPGLTASQLAVCALMFGAGATTPAIVKKVSPKPAAAKKVSPRSVASRAPAAPVAAPQKSNILDCPMQVPALNTQVIPNLQPTPNAVMWSNDAHAMPGGFAFRAVIPEGDIWVYMIAGFGFVGLSLRKKDNLHGTK
ncbi:MAG: hypothetical protein DDT36_00706 [Firmicutes bacterium]|nr:hypothetical protein [Bacillota bacterium]